jgi:hypothetical protein
LNTRDKSDLVQFLKSL